jgi:hypothetical protein
VIFNPFDHSIESAVWFFCRIRGARGSIGPQETLTPSVYFPLYRGRHWRIRFKSGPCPVCKYLPLDIPFYRVPERSSACSPAELDQPVFFLGHFTFVEHAVTAML